MARCQTGVDIDAAFTDDTTEQPGVGDTAEQPVVSDTVEHPSPLQSEDEFAADLDLDLSRDDEDDEDDEDAEAGGRQPDGPTMTEVGTKLDLASAYIDMGDTEGARSILNEVLEEAAPEQRQEAQKMLDSLVD